MASEFRLATQLMERNRAALRTLDIDIDLRPQGASAVFQFATRNIVGALPLVSPVTAQPEFGLVVAPRFGWRGLGAALHESGWKILPQLLRFPSVPASEREVPPWVLSSVVLLRLDAFLRQGRRNFTMREEETRAPRGTVRWEAYARQSLPMAQYLSIPCTFPELQDDVRLKGAIHWVLLRQIASLESQRAGGPVVLALLEIATHLLTLVRDCQPSRPSPAAFRAWETVPLGARRWLEGIEAMKWTTDERGLGGLADLQGLPWLLRMDEFFEAWVETLAGTLARRLGGTVTSGRSGGTLSPLRWEPPYAGSQRFLLPDVVLRQSTDHVIVFDAKYKEHWQEIGERAWAQQSENLQERHREDLLQVLAYSTLFPEARVTCCLAYPCRRDTWDRMKGRGMLVHRASVAAGSRDIRLFLCAVPFGMSAREIADELAPAFAD